MRLFRLSNNGSITVEMCLIMPIIIGVIVMLVMTLLCGVGQGEALGICQNLAYTYGCDDEKMEILEVKANQIQAKKGSGTIGRRPEVIMKCTREWDVCTDRLRRWQLYGDILWE